MIAVGAGAVAWWRRQGVARSWFLIGALTWTLSVVLKVAWALLTNEAVAHWLVGLFGPTVGAVLFWLYIGLLTGIFECGLTWLVVSRTLVARAEWNQAVGFGVGFGAVEAVLLGIVLIGWVLVSSMLTGSVPAIVQAPAAMAMSGDGLALALPIIERAAALLVHVYTCVLIIEAVRRRQRRSFWFAFAYKGGLDAIAAAAVLGFEVPDSLVRLVVFEAIVVLFAIVAWVGIGRLRADSWSEPDRG